MMFNGPNRFRRRTADVRVSQPFTVQAEIASFSTGPLEELKTVSGAPIMGIEPTMTSDGRLLLFQGGPLNNGAIDYLMYSYNPTPCAATGWSEPRPLSMMFNDTTPGIKRYPMAWQRMKAATGEAFGDTVAGGNLIRAAYPWVDHEGRNVLYAAVGFTGAAGGRREAMSLIGADTGWIAHHIDGSLNTDRQDIAHLFYSGPMWNFEQERALAELPARLEQRNPLPPRHQDARRALALRQQHGRLQRGGPGRVAQSLRAALSAHERDGHPGGNV
ncbi:hypothetical protein [Archangium violaceum]|uniref:hypothetical protein n=1 Tax=Archangium violaceum TaxID=83451 RepID=UPI000A806F8F|nr:hypothetical protein [Archangium violaceum]